MAHGLLRDIVNQLIGVPQWPLLMCCTITDDSDKTTTPFREMIKKMPGIDIIIHIYNIISPRRMHRRVTVVVLCVCVCLLPC